MSNMTLLSHRYVSLFLTSVPVVFCVQSDRDMTIKTNNLLKTSF